MYTTTPDEHFVVAVHPEHGNVTVACGFSGHGFKFVPVIGEVVADLVTEGETRYDLGFLSPNRFLPAQ
jgi:sarcosine oxidase